MDRSKWSQKYCFMPGFQWKIETVDYFFSPQKSQSHLTFGKRRQPWLEPTMHKWFCRKLYRQRMSNMKPLLTGNPRFSMEMLVLTKPRSLWPFLRSQEIKIKNTHPPDLTSFHATFVYFIVEAVSVSEEFKHDQRHQKNTKIRAGHHTSNGPS